MARAGISGIGVISALGGDVPETMRRLFAPEPERLPEPPRRIETQLALPVFEIAVPEAPAEAVGLPLRFLLHALEEALRAARLNPADLGGRRVGVAVGTTVACQLDDIPCHARMRDDDFGDLAPVLRYVTGMPAEFLRRRLGFDGPALTVSNACSSGADAVMIGLEWLRTGRCDLVIAAGCDSVSKVAFNGFNALRVCSPRPCRPFDAERAGLNLGDAAGVLILEDPARARERGLEPKYEIGGAGKTADAFHITQPEGSGRELERAVKLALAQAELTPGDIDFVNAHGTGTLVNDRVESAVLAQLFGRGLRYHSTKSLTGHTLGAAGAIEAIFTRLMLERRCAVPNHRCTHPMPEAPVPPLAAAAPVSGNAAVSTSLAFGGSNTALALRRCRAAVPETGFREIYVSGFALLPPGAPEREELVALCRRFGLRRPDRLTQLALAAAARLADAGASLGGDSTALLTVSSCGPGTTIDRVLDDILDFPEDEILPTGFSHSVINAAASYVSAAFGIHGPTFAFVGFEDPFYEAAEWARTMLSDGLCRQVLIVAADETSLGSRAAEKLRCGAPPRFGEGACALLVSAESGESRFGALRFGETAREAERLLSCGVPADFAEKLLQTEKAGATVLGRLAPPVWKCGK